MKTLKSVGLWVALVVGVGIVFPVTMNHVLGGQPYHFETYQVEGPDGQPMTVQEKVLENSTFDMVWGHILLISFFGIIALVALAPIDARTFPR